MKLQELLDDERLIYLLILALIAFVTLNPLGLPVAISDMTIEAYDYIESLPSGSYVVTDFAVTSAVRAPMAITLMNHLVTKDLKIVMLGTHAIGPAVMTAELVIPEVNWRDDKYGEDWIYLGYIPGYEAALNVFARDPKHAYETDYWGDPIQDQPIIKDMPPMEEMTGVVLTPGAPVLYVRQWAEPYGIKLVVCATGGLAETTPFIEAGYLEGLIAGLTGAAEYEKLSGIPAKATSRGDGLSILHLTLVTAVIISNAVYYAKWLRGEQQ